MLVSMAKREQFCTLQRAKVRISEHKTKEKLVFLCFVERKCLLRRRKVQINEHKTKGKEVFLCFVERKCLLQRRKVRISEHKTKRIILRRRLYSKEPGAIGGGLKGHENVHMKKFSTQAPGNVSNCRGYVAAFHAPVVSLTYGQGIAC